MAKPRLTDAQVAALPKERRERTLKRRRERERAKLKQGITAGKLATQKNVRNVYFSLPANPAPAEIGEVINGLDPDDLRARSVYCDFRTRLQAAGRWSGEATHGMLLTYVKASLEIERGSVAMVSGHVMTAQARAAMYLKLHELPADKVRKGAGRFDF